MSVSAPSLLEQKTLPTIVRLAAPTTGVMLVGAVSQSLYTYFVSRLGADAIAAVSLVYPISMILLTIMGGGVGAGISAAVARALGAGRRDEARAIAEHALVITVVLAVLGTLALEVGSESLFSWLGGRDDVLSQATHFARILFGGLLITFAVATLDSLMRAEGNTRIPALCGTLSLVLQTVFTPLFMFGLGLGLGGAPLAALGGQLVGLLPRLRYVFGGKSTLRPRLAPRRFRVRHLAEIFRVGAPASLSALTHYAGILVLTGIFGHFGKLHLAAYGLCIRLDFIVFTLGYGVATATLTLVGRAAGARRVDLVERYVWQSSALAAAWVLAPALVVAIFPGLWLNLFTDEPQIRAVGSGYFHVVGPTYVLAAISMVIASSFQALRRATIPLLTMTLRVAAVLGLSIAVTRVPGSSVWPVFVVIAVANALSTCLLIALFRRTVAAMRVRAAALAVPAVLAVLWVLPVPAPATGPSRFFFSGDGRLRLDHAHFAEHLDVRYRRADGTYDPAALERIAHFFRSRQNGERGDIALRTLELIDFIEDRFRPTRMVLISGYRSPEFNEQLRAHGARAAQFSLHTEGLAADIAFRGLDQKKLWARLRDLKLGGVGYYRKEGFLHVDSGRPRFWEPRTSKVEKNLSRGNAKIFARTEFDRYADLDGAIITLHGVTAWPLRIARTAELDGATLPLTADAEGAAVVDDCIVFSSPADSGPRLRVASATSVEPTRSTPSTESRRSASARARSVLRLRTCEPRVEATPPDFETNPIEVGDLHAVPPAW